MIKFDLSAFKNVFLRFNFFAPEDCRFCTFKRISSSIFKA